MKPNSGGMVSIEEIELAFGKKLPKAYADFLNDFDGAVFNNGIVLYPAADVVERNRTFEIQLYVPEVLAIGDDSGGRCFVTPFDEDGVYVLDQGYLEKDDLKMISGRLCSWLSQLRTQSTQ